MKGIFRHVEKGPNAANAAQIENARVCFLSTPKD